MIDDPALQARAAAIELLVLDVDGVLTDGRITLTADGSELKSFHVRDGSAIVAWRALGNRVAIISGRTSPAVALRAAELGIDPVRQGVSDKRAALNGILRAAGKSLEQTCAIGDDLPDLPILSVVGLPIAVADACPEVREAAAYVTIAGGGTGAVREAIEWLLRAQNLWNDVLKRFR